VSATIYQVNCSTLTISITSLNPEFDISSTNKNQWSEGYEVKSRIVTMGRIDLQRMRDQSGALDTDIHGLANLPKAPLGLG